MTEVLVGVVVTVLLGLVPSIVLTETSPPQMRGAMNQWLRWGLLGASAAAWTSAPFLLPIGLYLAIRWPKTLIMASSTRFPHESLPTVMAWVGIGLTWLAVEHAPARVLGPVPILWAGVGAIQAGIMLWQRLKHGPSGRVFGGLAQRTLAGAFFAIVLCAAPLWTWPPLLVGLWLSGPSWVAVLGFVAGLVIRWPALAPWLALAMVLAVGLVVVERIAKNRAIARGYWRWSLLERLTPRGDSLDSLYERAKMLAWVGIVMLEGRLWLWGTGPGSAGRVTRQWAGRSNSEPLGNLHCEPAQLFLEYGAFGLAALVLFSWRMASGLHLGDPWAAGAVAGGVIALGSLPARVVPVGVTWLILCAGAVK